MCLCVYVFLYAVTAALNHENIGKHLERISKIRSFIEQYECREIHFPAKAKDWKNFETNNKIKDFNILFLPKNREEIRRAFISKHSLKRENKVILLMITDGEKWHYVAVQNLPVLLRERTLNLGVDYYCMNCFHYLEQKINLNHIKI